MQVPPIILEKGLAILEVVLKRLLDPEAQEKAYTLAITKRKGRALEIAEQMFLAVDVDWIDQYVKIEDKDERVRWERFKKNYARSKERFFKFNN